MKDIIYRDDAINAVEEALKNIFVEPQGLGEKIINPLPSAERTGQWVRVYRNGFGNLIGYCEKCGRKYPVDNFCPNCGTRMVTE